MVEAPAFAKAFWRRPEAFYPGLPAFELLPLETWRKLSDKRLAQPRPAHLGYGNPGASDHCGWSSPSISQRAVASDVGPIR